MNTVRRIAVSAVVLFAVCGRPPAGLGAAPEDDRAESVVVFVDCSGSMLTPFKVGTSRFQEVTRRAMELVRVRLQAGANVRVVPFDSKPLDAFGTPCVVTEAKPLDEVLVETRKYLDARIPADDTPRTAIWDSIWSLRNDLAQLGRNTTVIVFTDDEEDNTSRHTRLEVEGNLRQLWGLPEAERVSIQMAVLLGTGRAAQVGVGLVPGTFQIPILPAADLPAGKDKLVDVPVKCFFSPDTSPKDSVDSVTAVVHKSLSTAPDLSVEAVLSKPLSKADPEGRVTLKLRGNLPEAVFDHQYTVRLLFRFKVDGEDVQTAAAGHVLRVEITSLPAVQVEIPAEFRDLSMSPGQVKTVPITLTGNADATNKTCALRAALVPEGFSCAFCRESDEVNATDFWSRKEINVRLGGEKNPAKVFMQIRADRAAAGKIVTTTLLAGQSKEITVAVTASQPTVRPRLLNPNNKTTLESTKDWKKLACGPIEVTHSGDGKATPNVTLTVQESSDDDVEVAFDADGKKARPAAIPDASGIDLFGRLRPGRTVRNVRVPPVRVDVDAVGDVKYAVEPPMVRLDGTVKTIAPDFWVLPVSPKAAPGGEADRKLTLESVRCRPGQSVQCDVDVKCTAAAVGSALSITAKAANAALKWETKGDLKATTEGVEIDKESGGRLLLKVTPTVEEGPGKCEVGIALPDGTTSTVIIPFTVQPPEFVVELQRGKESRSPLVLGTPVLVAHAAITGEGEVPLGLHAEFRSTVLDIPVRLGWDQDLRDKLSVAPEVPTDGLVYAMAKVPTNMSAKMVGRRITGELVVTATSDSDPKVRVRLRDQGHDVTAFPLEFEVKGWTLRIIYKGTDCTRLPPKQRTWIQIDKANQVLPMATALREPLGVEFENPGATTMPEDIAERTIAAKVVDPSGTVQAAGFELEGESKPVWLVKVRDLDRVRDIVLVGGTGVSRGVYSKYNGGAEVVFEVSGYPDRVRVPIYTIVPGDSSMVVKAMLLGLGLVLAGFIVWKLARKVPPPGPRVVTVSNLKDLELTEPAIGAGGFLDASGEALTQGQDAAQSSKPSGQDAARSTGEPPSPAVPPPPRPTGGSGTSGGSWMDNV